ncbi:MAG: DHA2 family efflux MFS transporter permease subunit [Rhodospirillaceae bacterium]|nr:DHA2 family efflux MFS transporter permease subunit [Rhodospirillaceae bacterium]MBT3908925.1 DHA2 family efflux MFS transporter permease subunit [Rhodospirillaceae bacterium]MBT6884518.1 DHA2 family efflux MFS transporter permease subunit [Rhodospirillaceae bacterium]MBT7512035.1 DHA2 family efflux MFS transporter permease subunit [Rhodospirillaceae bacterium]
MPPAPSANPAIDGMFEKYGPAYRWLVVASGLMGSLSMVLSATMVNVAVPSIMGAFGVGQDLAQWAATAFLTTMVASQLLNAWMIGAFGQRAIFCFALVTFTVGAFVGATSTNIETLIAGRIMQGFSAGLVQPLVLSTVVAVFPAERRGFAVGVYGMGVTLAPSFGPFLGGLAIDAFTWRHLFMAPLPLVFLAFFMGLVFMPPKRAAINFPPFNWSGYILVGTALLCIMSVIGNGQRWGWSSDRTSIFLSVGVSAAVAFVYTQLNSKSPLLDVTLFKDLRFTSAMFIAFAFGAGNFATNYAIPVFVQTVQGFSPTAAGLVIVPAGLLLISLIPLSGRLADTIPSHYPLMAGCVIFAFAAYLLSDTDVNTAFWSIALIAMLSRFAIGMVMPNLGKVALSSVPADRLNAGAGTYNFMRQMGGAFGVNVTALSIEMRTAHHADLLTATQTSDNTQSLEVLERISKLLSEGGIPDAALSAGSLNYLSEVIYAQARTFGFQDSFFQIAFAFCVAFIPAWFLGRASRKRT